MTEVIAHCVKLSEDKDNKAPKAKSYEEMTREELIELLKQDKQ